MTTKEENRKQARQVKRSQRKAKRERKSDKKAEGSKAARKKGQKHECEKLNKKSAKNLVILAKITIKWRAAVCEAQSSLKEPKLMIKGIKEAQGRLREA